MSSVVTHHMAESVLYRYIVMEVLYVSLTLILSDVEIWLANFGRSTNSCP